MLWARPYRLVNLVGTEQWLLQKGEPFGGEIISYFS